MAQNTLREHIGSLIMPRLDVSSFYSSKEYRAITEGYIKKNCVGGFCIFGSSRSQTQNLLGELQLLRSAHSSHQLLFSMDAEWGTAMRLKEGGTEFPHAMALTRTGDPVLVEEVAYANGVELRNLGIHWNFAPVADINSNPANPIINIRAFGETPEDTSRFSLAYFNGLKRSGILATAKHFPGHGNTHVDSHTSLPILEEDFVSFSNLELKPFKNLINEGIDSVMLGHLTAPQLAKSLGATAKDIQLPATISPWLCKKLLRNELGFNRVIVTDSLEMAAMTKYGLSGDEIALQSILADVDILLMPPNPEKTFDSLASSAEAGKIGEERIYQSLNRISKLYETISQDTVVKDVKYLDPIKRGQLALHSAKRSLLLKGEVPKGISPSSIIVFSGDNPTDAGKVDAIMEQLPSSQVVRFILGDRESPDLADNAIFFILDRPRGVLTEEKREKSVLSAVRSITEQMVITRLKPAGVVLCGNPYLENEILKMKPKFVLHTYSDSLPSIMAAIELLKEKMLP